MISPSSPSLILQPSGFHQRIAALVRKLRGLRNWSQSECALRGGISPADVQVVEDQLSTTVNNWERRITCRERAFAMPLRKIVAEDMAVESGTNVVPFLTADQPIHQNSFEWTGGGVLLDVVDHAPQFSLLPVTLIKRFIGKNLPESFMHFVKRRSAVVTQSAIARPHSLWNHYQRLITAAKRDEYAAPLRYDAVTSSGQKLLRKVTCVKLSDDCFETQTHVVSEVKTLDLACCGKYDDCRACISADAARVFSRIKRAS